MKVYLVTLLGSLIFSASVFSMGGDKPGPNGGHITMPGTYHVELVEKPDSFRVYLLDMSMKNPLTAGSKVTLIITGQDSEKIPCKEEKNYFSCVKPKKNLNMFKEIKIESMRNKVKGSAAIYKLPLKYE
ncbi:MAG: hypothetical protein ACXVLQ_06565 [Bacteriovorax sp.]